MSESGIYLEPLRCWVEIVRTAKWIVRGELDPARGVCRLVGLGYELQIDMIKDEDFGPLTGIADEWDELPVEDADRRNWHPLALYEKDPEIDRLNDRLRPFTVEVCQRLIKRFEAEIDAYRRGNANNADCKP